MTADLLREAAALMRQRAGLAIPGPWVGYWPGDGTARVVETVTGDRDEVASTGSIAESEHIASWHPTVALAAADWLDSAADGDGSMPHRFPQPAPDAEIIAWTCRACRALVSELRERTDCTVDWRPRDPRALAVARAYLGRES